MATSASFFFSSSSVMTVSIFALSFKTIPRFSVSSRASDSAVSNIASAFLFTPLPSFSCSDSRAVSSFTASSGERAFLREGRERRRQRRASEAWE